MVFQLVQVPETIPFIPQAAGTFQSTREQEKIQSATISDGVTINAGAGSDTIYCNGGSSVTIQAGAGNDSIFTSSYVYPHDIAISAGAGADTVSNLFRQVTIDGGDGNDVFIYTVGKDVITDYAAGDKISLGTSISKATVSGSDVILTIGKKGTLTVKDGANKKLNMISPKGRVFDTLVSGPTTLKITNSTKSPITLASDVGTADASKRTKNVKIFGNKLDNVILGGSKNNILYDESGKDSIVGNAGADKLYGGAGNDTLIGGKGNDSLWGDADADTFIYSSGDGKDVIYGFDSKDTLTFDNLDFTTSYSASKGKIVFKVDGGSITLNDFTTKTFHINNNIYKISGSKFVKK